MKKQVLEIKQAVKEAKLIKDIGLELNKSIKSSKKDIAWFQFARYSQYGYRFLKNKEEQYEILEEIANRLVKIHKNYTTGQIVDMMSELINTRVVDDIHIHGLKIKTKLTKKEKEYTEKLLIEIVTSEQYILGYSWLMPIAKLKSNNWKVKNLSLDKVFNIRRTMKNKYLLYNISQ
jgi:hypothetical protein